MLPAPKPLISYSILERIIALSEIVLVAAIGYLFSMTDAAIAALLLLALHRRKVLLEMLTNVISWKSRARLVFFFTAVIWIVILSLPFLLSFAGVPKPDYSYYSEQLRDNPEALFLNLLKVWTVVTFGEEFVGRVFLIDRIETVFKGTPFSIPLAIILSSLLFGLAHSYQGLGGIILAGSLSVMLSILYLNQKRSIWTNVLVHGTVDSIALVLAFWNVKF